MTDSGPGQVAVLVARFLREGLQTVLGVRVTFEPVDPHTFVRAEHKSRRVVDQRDHLRR